MPFDEKLIRLFAAHKVSEIDAVDEYRRYCEANKDVFGFRAARGKIEDAKRTIEVPLDRQEDSAGHVRQALILLESHRLMDFSLYYKLIEASYKPQWSPAQQKYFEHAARIVQSGNYFVLSFTDRPIEDGLADKRVNRRYWYYITRTIRNATVAERRTRNLLADAIHTKLADENLHGFYYKHKRQDSDNAQVEPKLREAFASCLVFVQLVDNAMFIPDPAKPRNFCQFEYELATSFFRELGQVDEDRVLFLVTEENRDRLTPPDLVHAPYKPWVEHIWSKASVYLPPAEEYKKEIIDSIRTKVRDVADQIRRARTNLLTRVPD